MALRNDFIRLKAGKGKTNIEKKYAGLPRPKST